MDGPEVLSCSVDEYHARPEVSSTQLRHYILHGPWSYYHTYILRTVPPEETDSKRLGRAFHLAMQLPESWQEHVYQLPSVVPVSPGMGKAESEFLRTLPPGTDFIPVNLRYERHREYIAEKEAQALSRGQIVATAEEYSTIKGMVVSVHENPACRSFVGQGICEVPARRQCPDTGLWLRSLADIWIPDPEIIVDFKSTRFFTKGEFCSDAIRKGYQYQLAFYRRVFNSKRHIIIAVRNEAPFESMCYELPQSLLDIADQSNLQCLQLLKASHDHDSWHSLGWGETQALTA